MPEPYDHKATEKKWQERWEKEGTFRADDSSQKPKHYILDMFPYPSGDGLHVGHVQGYTASDIYSRYKRMQGFNVLHPMGWDAFGLPAENYAIKTGVLPQETTDKSIINFRRQMKMVGLSYDWSREIGTHNPNYYRWTQWLFTKFFEKGLVYKKKALVNWDPVDQTVLANEQVLPDGTAERSGAKIEKRDLEQWFFKITDYADELIDGLEKIDWPESTKINQRNWIGRSEGMVFTSPVKDTNLTIDTFSAHFEAFRADTFVVIAPDHPRLPEILKGVPDEEKILAAAKKMADERNLKGFEEEKELEGIFTGRYTVDPIGNGELPIWIANYALADYGTGIVKCSAHDERDLAFAKKYDIPLKEVLEPVLVQTTGSAAFREHEPVQDSHGVIAIVKHWSEKKYMALRWPEIGWGTLLTGGIDEGYSPEETTLKEIREETGYKNAKIVKKLGVIHSKYYHAAKKLNRFGHAPTFYVELQDGEKEEVSDVEAKKHELLWLTAEELGGFLTAESHKYALKKFLGTAPAWIDMKQGILTEPEEFAGKAAGEVRQDIVRYLESHNFAKTKTTYRLRDWLISRQRYWGAPIPVVYDPERKPHAIPEEHLPWMLPTDVEFKPTGTSPLGQSKELAERTERIFGKGWKPEIDTMDTFADSSWYFFRFADPHNDKEFASKEAMQKWLPVDLYIGGAEHTVLHLLYARFFTKALRDMGYVSFDEPFLKLRHQGIILAEDSRKMSKRWGNVVNPDDMAERFGADAVRMYEMFMGPLEAMKPWNTKSIAGLERFVQRIWKLAQKPLSDAPATAELEAVLHKTAKKVGEDIETFKFNTAVSQLMIALNAMEEAEGLRAGQWRAFLRLLAPFAPHLTEELWEKFGEPYSIHTAQWPQFDPAKIVSDTATVAVQVNGKVRASILLSVDTTEDDALATARMNPVIQKWLEGKEEKRAVYVAGRIISFFVE